MNDTVDIIVLTFNRLKYFKSYVEMLHLSTTHPFRIFAVDNGSIDGTRDFILKMEEAGLIHRHLFTDNNMPMAKAFSAGFNTFKNEMSDFVMTSADDHTPPIGRPVDWLTLFVKKMKSDEKIGTINFKAVRQNYDSFQRKSRPLIESEIKNIGGELLDKFNFLQKVIYDK